MQLFGLACCCYESAACWQEKSSLPVGGQGRGVLWAELRGGLQLCRQRKARQHSQVNPSPQELVAEPGGSG